MSGPPNPSRTTYKAPSGRSKTLEPLGEFFPLFRRRHQWRSRGRQGGGEEKEEGVEEKEEDCRRRRREASPSQRSDRLHQRSCATCTASTRPGIDSPPHRAVFLALDGESCCHSTPNTSPAVGQAPMNPLLARPRATHSPSLFFVGTSPSSSFRLAAQRHRSPAFPESRAHVVAVLRPWLCQGPAHA